MDKKLKKNDEIILTIDRLGDNGEGIAVYDGIVVFVPFALPGEEVLVHIINDKHSFLVGKVVEIKKTCKERTEPLCPHFKKCGGCNVQHLPYEAQLEFKKNMVKNALKKYAKIDDEILDCVPSDKEFRYRNKFAFPVQEENGEVKIGMYQSNSHRIIEVNDCLLQSERAKTIVKLFKEFMTKEKLTAYNEQTKKGLIKHIVVREAGDAFILTVVVTDKKFNKFDTLINLLKSEFNDFGIIKNINTLGNNVIFGNTDELVYGLENLKLCDFGVNYEINNRSFLQVNSYIKNVIYQKIIDTVGEQKNIIDAYSGAGLLSSILAKNAGNVIGVEIIQNATENANKLKSVNNLHNLTNINGDCAKEIPRLAKELEGDFAVVVDPPRKGLDKPVVDAMLEAKPKQIVYLSCNPATLARDLSYLKEQYDIEFIQPYDMFPQTANVETLVSLKLK